MTKFQIYWRRLQDKILLAGPKLEWATSLAECGWVGDQPQQGRKPEDQS